MTLTGVATDESLVALVRAGHPRDEVLDAIESLLGARGERLDALLAEAGALRDAGLSAAGRPGVITYSRKVFIPLTTLCRDRCHYCIFVDTPGQLLAKNAPVYMSAEQVLDTARRGRAAGCKEALLTLGDRPEERWPQARAWLTAHGYASTIAYVADMARLITTETGLLCHANPGVMTPAEFELLRPTAPSMGMMLETTSRRLFEEPGQVHFGSPDKDPALRLRVIDDAGRARVPFTTGILVGIGETLRDRAESLLALRDAHATHGHLQEVIIQNFRAKPRTAMADVADADLLEYVAAIAVARIVLGPAMRIQVPPNLTDAAEFDLLIRAGADDWGGVSPLTADHVNPERPWPHLDDLAELTARAGFALRERLTAQPEFVLDAATWIDPYLHAAVSALAEPGSGLAARRGASRPAASAPGRPPSRGLGDLVATAAQDPLGLGDDDWVALLEATGPDLEHVVRTADDVRRYTVGEAIGIVVNRNLTSTGYRAGETRRPEEFTREDAAAIARDAWAAGATELCVQGRLPADEDPAGYLEIVRAVRASAPGIHLHAYRPQDVWDLADRTGATLDAVLGALHEAGVGSIPGTGVKILSERVRRLIAPDDLDIDRWVEAVTTAHGRGLRSTSVLFYGHVETAAERVSHLRLLRSLQDRTGGFTEFVPIPLPGHGRALVDGRSALDEHRAMVAVSRLALTGSIPHVQVPWPRHDPATVRALLAAGGDDLGGTLLDGTVKPQAGVEHGRELPLDGAAKLTGRLFRPLRQRTTDYREPAADRKAAAR